MAIYHFSAKIIKRTDGRSAVAAAAYRAGEKLIDERQGLAFEYARKERVEHTAILAPESAPAFVCDRARLWNSIEQAEKRKDAQTAREVEVALPAELNFQQRRELVERFIQCEFIERGMVADYSMHNDRGGANPHCHILLSMRELCADGWGKKVREWNSKPMLEGWRAAWANHVNGALERGGYSVRVDHRTLIDQGIEREPQLHHGNKPVRIAQNEAVKAHAVALIDLAAVRFQIAAERARLAARSPSVIRNEACREHVTAMAAVVDMRDQVADMDRRIERLVGKRTTQTARQIAAKNEKLVVAQQRCAQRRAAADAAQATLRDWQHAHPMLALLPLLPGVGLQKTANKAQADAEASEAVVRHLQMQIFAPAYLKILGAKIRACNTDIEKQLRRLSLQREQLGHALAAAVQRADRAQRAWEPYKVETRAEWLRAIDNWPRSIDQPSALPQQLKQPQPLDDGPR